MKIVQARRISQIFFFALFVWLVIVSTVGDKFWQIRNWPVNLFLHLDPLVAIGTIFTTHTLYYPLLLGTGYSCADNHIRTVFLQLGLSVRFAASFRRLFGQSAKKGAAKNPAE